MAVIARFIWTGSVQQRAADLDISPSTLAARVRRACFQLADMDTARRRALPRAPEHTSV